VLVRVEQRLEAAHEDALVAARLAALLLEAVARLAAQLELCVALETARPDLAQRGERVLAEGAEERLVPRGSRGGGEVGPQQQAVVNQHRRLQLVQR